MVDRRREDDQDDDHESDSDADPIMGGDTETEDIDEAKQNESKTHNRDSPSRTRSNKPEQTLTDRQIGTSESIESLDTTATKIETTTLETNPVESPDLVAVTKSVRRVLDHPVSEMIVPSAVEGRDDEPGSTDTIQLQEKRSVAQVVGTVEQSAIQRHSQTTIVDVELSKESDTQELIGVVTQTNITKHDRPLSSTMTPQKINTGSQEELELVVHPVNPYPDRTGTVIVTAPLSGNVLSRSISCRQVRNQSQSP